MKQLGIQSHNTDLIFEDSLSVQEAARAFCRGTTTIRRYVTLGILSPVTGRRVYLEACYGTANEYRTSRQAWRRFQERINGVIE